MATISNIINLVSCGLSATYGTGSKGCKALFRNVASVWLTKRGFTFDSTKEFDEEYIQSVQASGDLIILKGVKTFTDNSEEGVTQTYDDGTEQHVRKGKYKFLVEFVNGLYFQSALNSINSFEEYDVSLVDSSDNVLGTLDIDGSHKGFSAGMIQVSKFTFGTGSEGQKQGLMIQLTEPDELDDTYSFISGKSIYPYKPKNADGINEIALSYVSEPADGDTSLVVKAVIKQGGSAFSGLDFSDFILKVNGTTVNPTASTEVDGVYTLTVSSKSTNEVLALSLYDSTENNEVINLDDVLYKSNTLTATVV